jgi:hypothetical protein
VATIIEKSGVNMTTQVSDLKGWVKEILNGTCARLVRYAQPPHRN